MYVPTTIHNLLICLLHVVCTNNMHVRQIDNWHSLVMGDVRNA